MDTRSLRDYLGIGMGLAKDQIAHYGKFYRKIDLYWKLFAIICTKHFFSGKIYDHILQAVSAGFSQT